MAPDIDELIKRVNTLTLDKNRLRQKLNQLSLNNGPTTKETQSLLSHQLNILSGTSSSSNNEVSVDSSKSESPKKSPTSSSLASANCGGDAKNSYNSNVISGVECSTSCEDDLLYVNELYKNRLDEYNDNWDFLQSKCSALLSELNALQKHYAILKAEKLDLEEMLKNSCDEYDKVRGELQTVVVNYESQLSAMSDHLSMITSQARLTTAPIREHDLSASSRGQNLLASIREHNLTASSRGRDLSAPIIEKDISAPVIGDVEAFSIERDLTASIIEKYVSTPNIKTLKYLSIY